MLKRLRRRKDNVVVSACQTWFGQQDSNSGSSKGNSRACRLRPEFCCFPASAEKQPFGRVCLSCVMKLKLKPSPRADKSWSPAPPAASALPRHCKPPNPARRWYSPPAMKQLCRRSLQANSLWHAGEDGNVRGTMPSFAAAVLRPPSFTPRSAGVWLPWLPAGSRWHLRGRDPHKSFSAGVELIRLVERTGSLPGRVSGRL